MEYLTSGGQKLVYPKLIQSREEEGTKVVKINEDLTLNLEKSSVMGKEFLLRTYQGHVMQHNYLDGEALEEDLYHDARMFASVIVSEENGLQIEGLLNPNLAIKPLEGQKRSDEAQDMPHVIYNVEDHDGTYAGEGVAIEEREGVSERQNQSGARPETIHPELIVLVDSTLSAQFETNYTLLKYIIITLNSVNVRYLTLSHPFVRIKLCAMEILTVAEESFLIRHGNYVQGTRSLAGLRDHVQNNAEKYDTYDGVYLATGLDMAEPSERGWNSGVLGFAYVGRICKSDKVAYGEDKAGTFKGVRVLAHEFGHLLGCPHDGSKSGFLTSERCPWKDGYLMSYIQKDSNSMKFSQCCNSMISWMAWSNTGKCLRTLTAKQVIQKEYHVRLLPGNVLTRDQVCQISFPKVQNTRFVPDYDGNENCLARCFMPKSVYGFETVLPTFLPDNSPCTENNGTICRNGDCIRETLKYRQYKPF
ncbi:venom metalloproteinase antarease TserMP_A-like isoform X2 [Rhipicephalus microplus]|uniref:venom metalloproteinase antarease TserMP_A-like isoform X2 n=1 Tax=Rhipicephalus microplus TaxID=6941 RepID=UPI003F6C74B6